MQTSVLSYHESAVLGAAGKTGAAYRTQLPSMTLLSPSEVREAVNSLLDKRLLMAETEQVRLTKEGRQVLDAMRKRPSSAPNRVLVTDEITARSITTNSRSVRLNESVDEELKKLQQ